MRVVGLAQPGQVLVTDVTDSLAGRSGTPLVDEGEHVLRGIEEPRRLFAVQLG